MLRIPRGGDDSGSAEESASLLQHEKGVAPPSYSAGSGSAVPSFHTPNTVPASASFFPAGEIDRFCDERPPPGHEEEEDRVRREGSSEADEVGGDVASSPYLLPEPTNEEIFSEQTTHFKECSDVLGVVIDFLPNRDIIRSRQVAHRWREVIDDTGLPLRLTRELRESVEDHNAQIREHYGKNVILRRNYLFYVLVYTLLPVLVISMLCVPRTQESLKIGTYALLGVLSFFLCIPFIALGVYLFRSAHGRHTFRPAFVGEMIMFTLFAASLACGVGVGVSKLRFGQLLNEQELYIAECPAQWSKAQGYPSSVRFLYPQLWNYSGSIPKDDFSVDGYTAGMFSYVGEPIACQVAIPPGCVDVIVVNEGESFTSLPMGVAGELTVRTILNGLWFSTINSKFSLSSWMATFYWKQYTMPLLSTEPAPIPLDSTKRGLYALVAGYFGLCGFFFIAAGGIYCQQKIELERRQLRVPFVSADSMDSEDEVETRRRKLLFYCLKGSLRRLRSFLVPWAKPERFRTPVDPNDAIVVRRRHSALRPSASAPVVRGGSAP